MGAGSQILKGFHSPEGLPSSLWEVGEFPGFQHTHQRCSPSPLNSAEASLRTPLQLHLLHVTTQETPPTGWLKIFLKYLHL